MTCRDEFTYLPDCWDDDVRMSFMFLAFRNQSVNPTAWQSKMDFWIECVRNFCELRSQITFSQKDIEQAFKRKEKIPACIGTVLSEMSRQKVLLSYPQYVSSLENKGWISWGYNLTVKKPLSWGWNTLKSSIMKNPDQASEKMVNVTVLKSISEKLLKKLTEQAKTTFHFDEVHEIGKSLNLDSHNLELCLIHLEKKSLATISTVEQDKYVKILVGEQLQKKSITAEDIGIVRLKRVQNIVEEEIKNLEVIIEKKLAEAKSYLKNGSRNMAKNCLKKKKKFEDILSKKEIVLENIQVLIEKIEESESNRKVAEAYKAGVDAYKHQMEGGGLNLENLDDIMISVQEVLGMHEDIMETVSSPVDTTVDFDADELERELAEIVANSKESEENTPDVVVADVILPNVPSGHDISDLEARLQRLRSPISGKCDSIKKPGSLEAAQ